MMMVSSEASESAPSSAEMAEDSFALVSQIVFGLQGLREIIHKWFIT